MEFVEDCRRRHRHWHQHRCSRRGQYGIDTRLNYTVIGDGVNLASRLEGLTKLPEYDTRIIVSAGTLARAKEPCHLRPLGEVAVKGRQKATEIFALLGRTPIE